MGVIHSSHSGYNPISRSSKDFTGEMNRSNKASLEFISLESFGDSVWTYLDLKRQHRVKNYTVSWYGSYI